MASMGWLLGRSVVFQHTTFFIPPVIIKIIPNIFNRRILVNPSITTNPDQWPVIILKVIIKTIPNFFNCQFIKYWLTLSPLTIGMMCELISDCQFWSYIKVFFFILITFFYYICYYIKVLFIYYHSSINFLNSGQ